MNLRPLAGLGIAVGLVVTAAACGDPTSSPTAPPASASPAIHVISATVSLLGGNDGLLGFAAHNAGAETDRLTAAACEGARRAEVVGRGQIDPEVTGLFGPEGDHVLLGGLGRTVHVGDFLDCTLTFEIAGNISTEAKVVKS